VETAFLNGTVTEEIYIRQPQGYERGEKGKVCHLLKAIYGLKQAASAWYKLLDATLPKSGLSPTAADPCMYKGTINEETIYVLVYVDDLLIAAKTEPAVTAGKKIILDAFKARDIGEPTYFLGMHIHRPSATGVVKLGQHQYVANVLARFKMSDANPTRLPMAAGLLLRKEGQLLPGELISTYQELLGALLYLATCTRPDISFAFGRLSRYASAQTTEHLGAAKSLLRYLRGTADLGLSYGVEGALTDYSDADFAADVDSRRSTTGYVFTFNGGAISWLSKIQPTVAASTTEAQYISAAMAAKEAMWLRRLMGDLTGVTKAVNMKCDNQGAIALMHNAACSARTKHIDINFHFIREKVKDKTLAVEHVLTDKMTADALTKPLGTLPFTTCRDAMGVAPTQYGDARGGVLAREQGEQLSTAPPPLAPRHLGEAGELQSVLPVQYFPRFPATHPWVARPVGDSTGWSSPPAPLPAPTPGAAMLRRRRGKAE